MKCPGQDTRYWQPGSIFEAKCPQCGREVEFFKDEATRKCRNCGHKFVNPKMDFGCASYCKYAEQCLGDLPPELLAGKENLLKDRVAVEIKRYFKQDFKRIAHTMKVARYAEQIVREEKGNPAVVLLAAYLHDLGSTQESSRQQSGASLSPEEGRDTAAEEASKILGDLGARKELIEEVRGVIRRHHQPGNEDTLSSKVLHDAHLLAGLEEDNKEQALERDKLEGLVTTGFLTDTGRELAQRVLPP